MSWSVTLNTLRPAAPARVTSAAGASNPSDAVVCRCRSINVRLRAGSRRGPPDSGRRRGRASGGGLLRPRFPLRRGAPALALKAREFVEAARTFGSTGRYILTRHLLLNLIAPLTVTITLALAWSLLTESGLSFLGLGSQPPAPSLGVMLAESKSMMTRAPWLMVFPGLTIMLAILGFNLCGDALRDILDPRTQGRAA